MKGNSSTNFFIEMVPGKIPDTCVRDLRRYKYKYAEGFWSLALLIFERDKKMFQNRIHQILTLYSELFYNSLPFYYGCLKKLDQMDRDEINSHRDQDAIQSFVEMNSKVVRELEQTMNEILASRTKKNQPIEYPISFSSKPQPYLPACEQILKGICTLTDFKLTNDIIEWPYEQLSKTELKKLQKFGKTLFPYIILNEIAAEVTTFDKSKKMTFSAFRVVYSEVDAVHDYLPKYNNFLQLNNEQIGFRITEKYRNHKGERLNSATVNRNIQRYYEKLGA